MSHHSNNSGGGLSKSGASAPPPPPRRTPQDDLAEDEDGFVMGMSESDCDVVYRRAEVAQHISQGEMESRPGGSMARRIRKIKQDGGGLLVRAAMFAGGQGALRRHSISRVVLNDISGPVQCVSRMVSIVAANGTHKQKVVRGIWSRFPWYYWAESSAFTAVVPIDNEHVSKRCSKQG